MSETDALLPSLVVVATWFNHPELLGLHRDTWVNAFPSEKVEYIAYIDAKDPVIRIQLVEAAKNAAISAIEVAPILHTRRQILFPRTAVTASHASSFRNAGVCQYAWIREAITHRKAGRLIFTQSDIFPFRSQTWAAWMGGALFSYRPQHRISEDGQRRLDYAWEGLCGFDLERWTPKMLEAISFEAGFFKGVFGDTGAGTWLLLAALPAAAKREWYELDSRSWSPAEVSALPSWLQRFLALDPRGEGPSGPAYGELFDNWCFHLRGGSDYEKADKAMLQLRFALFQAFLYEEMIYSRGPSDPTDANTQSSHQALDA